MGWTGSRSTNPYLNDVLPLLSQLQSPIRVKVISETVDGIDFSLLRDVPRTFVPWSPAVEVVEAASFDIGVMPVPDNRSRRENAALRPCNIWPWEFQRFAALSA